VTESRGGPGGGLGGIAVLKATPKVFGAEYGARKTKGKGRGYNGWVERGRKRGRRGGAVARHSMGNFGLLFLGLREAKGAGGKV